MTLHCEPECITDDQEGPVCMVRGEVLCYKANSCYGINAQAIFRVLAFLLGLMYEYPQFVG